MRVAGGWQWRMGAGGSRVEKEGKGYQREERVAARLDVGQKPLKRLRVVRVRRFTPLKRGVNERKGFHGVRALRVDVSFALFGARRLGTRRPHPCQD